MPWLSSCFAESDECGKESGAVVVGNLFKQLKIEMTIGLLLGRHRAVGATKSSKQHPEL
jgi:hypothetical protein